MIEFVLLSAAGGPPPIVTEIALCLLAAAALAVAGQRFKVPVVAAFLAAGVLIGPIGLALVTDKESIETIAKLGLTLLLFVIGLEINVKSLLRGGRALLVPGLAQVPLTVLAGTGVFLVAGSLGFALFSDSYTALYFGLAAAFSSTLLVVKTMQERLQIDTVDGRLAVGLLIFQDLWAIVVLALQPSLANPDIAPILRTFTGIALLVVVAFVFTKFVLPSAFRTVARSPEMVVTLALGWCFGLGILASHLGALAAAIGIHLDLSVSMEMGALIAGASIATFPYAHEVVAKVGNLRDFFVTLFFVALGMGIPVPHGISGLLWALVLASVAVALRYLTFLPLFSVSGVPLRYAVTTSTKLAQISEFSLVILYLGHALGHLSEEAVAIVVFAFVITAIATPGLFSVADPVYGRIAATLARVGFVRKEQAATAAHAGHGGRIVLLGFHRTASSLLHDISIRHPDLVPEVLVVDFNVQLHDAVRKTGAQCVYGDIANPATLLHTGIAEAEVVISTVPDDLLRGTTNRQIAAAVRALAPKALIVANAVRVADVRELYAAGADYVFMARTETSIGILPAVEAALNGELAEFVDSRRREQGDLETRGEVLD
jgi:Kef-type K+ transport system membrane component KefB